MLMQRSAPHPATRYTPMGGTGGGVNMLLRVVRGGESVEEERNGAGLRLLTEECDDNQKECGDHVGDLFLLLSVVGGLIWMFCGLKMVMKIDI